jgi:RHS repeat-associated protein
VQKKTSVKENIGRALLALWLLLFPLAAAVSAAEDKRPRPREDRAPAAAPAKPSWKVLDELRAWEGVAENSRQGSLPENALIPAERFLIKPDSRRASGGGGGRTAVASEKYTFGDALQSVHQTTNDSGALVDTRFTDAWGIDIAVGDPPPTGPGSRWGFTGRENDVESGLMHYRARSYDPMTGRFTSRDPVVHSNLYHYCDNDPVNHTDPSGMLSKELEAELRGYSDQARGIGAFDLAGAYEGLIAWEKELEAYYPGASRTSSRSREFVLEQIDIFQKRISSNPRLPELYGADYVDPARQACEDGGGVADQRRYKARVAAAIGTAGFLLETGLSLIPSTGADLAFALRDAGEGNFVAAVAGLVPILGDAGKLAGKLAFKCPDGTTRIFESFAELKRFAKLVDAELHHIATNKNVVSVAGGGPFTPKFHQLFTRAGMSLDDVENLMILPGHQGPHPGYNSAVFERLRAAVQDVPSDQYRSRFRAELDAIKRDTATSGHELNKLATGK